MRNAIRRTQVLVIDEAHNFLRRSKRTTALFSRADTPVRWQDATQAGCLCVVADATTLRGRFVDADGTTAFERTLTARPPGQRL